MRSSYIHITLPFHEEYKCFPSINNHKAFVVKSESCCDYDWMKTDEILYIQTAKVICAEKETIQVLFLSDTQ